MGGHKPAQNLGGTRRDFKQRRGGILKRGPFHWIEVPQSPMIYVNDINNPFRAPEMKDDHGV